MIKKLREPVNSLTHWGGAILALIGLIALLIVGWSTPAKIISLTIYGISLIAMFSASATYHMVRVKDKTLEIFRKVDHSAIFLLIAGTYTPVCLLVLEGRTAVAVLVAVWTGAAVGAAVAIIGSERGIRTHYALYIALGGVATAAMPQMARNLSVPEVVLVVVGGLLYTLGAATLAFHWPDPFPRVFGYHEVWHTFVVIAVVCQFVALASVIVDHGA